jgi:rsbT co-antagonist protein RsbR
MLLCYSTFIWKAIKEEMDNNNMSIETAFKVGAIINPLMHHAAYCFSLTYIDFYRSNLDNVKTALIELSVPVVHLKNGYAILPLIGNIDTERAKILIEETLKSANRLKLETLIIDLSGVYIVDTIVADQIFKLIESLNLLGVESIVTGVRPEVAQLVLDLIFQG